jgi:hypothetical protein
MLVADNVDSYNSEMAAQSSRVHGEMWEDVSTVTSLSINTIVTMNNRHGDSCASSDTRYLCQLVGTHHDVCSVVAEFGRFARCFGSVSKHWKFRNKRHEY